MQEDRENAENVSGIKPPKYFCTNSENVAVNWNLWLQQWDWYATATNMHKKKPEVQVAVFMTSIGPEAAVIFNTFGLTQSQSTCLKTIKGKFTAYFTPKVNETYERYMFNLIVQRENQPVDEFITNLKNKIKNCGYGNIEESIIRDRIVMGIKSDSTREKLLAESDLTLQKTIDICHSAEQVKMQVNSMKQAVIVEAVTWNKNKTKLANKQGKNMEEKFHCGRCDTEHGRKECPAFRKICKICNKRNHFSKCCKTKKVESVERNNYSDSSEEEINETFHVFSLNSECLDTEDWFEEASLPRDTTVKFKLDSGAQCNVITKKIVEKTKVQIKTSTIKCLTSYTNHTLPVVGERIEALTKEEEQDLFEGMGCLKQFKYDIDIIDSPKLPICPARKVPYIIRDTVKKELDSMVAQKVIKPVTKPTPAVSPMVVVRKNNKIRLCIDPSEINKNLKRRHYPLNTVEEIIARIYGSKWFTLLDCKRGFWQLQVTKRTSEYLTFSTPFGRYSCLRMPFGLASAPEVFQQVMNHLLTGISNVEVSMDDILLHADTKEKLEKITQKVLQKFRNSGLKLNKEKCIFNVQEVKFLGHIVTCQGLRPDPEKLEAISKIKEPQNVKELQRFLGLVTYLSKFIKNLADITGPLRVLLQKEVAWYWNHEQEASFLKLKELLKTPPVLGYYNPKAPIILSVDASSYACGGVLIQEGKPIAYCAKSFTKTEQGYSQLEKEALAILVACKKFHSYIWGCKDLTIESDHKPLETIFKKALVEAPPRLQRICYQILPYNPKVIYKKGSWPEKIEYLKDNLRRYWYYRESLSINNDIIFKNDRVLVPRSMVPVVLKYCHLSHKGIQGTLQLARDNVFWPDMTRDITNYVKDCRACNKVQKDNPMEPILLQDVPQRPWSIVATDLFHLRGKDYLLIADAYSGYFDFKQLTQITSTAIIGVLKSWFANFGIPDILQSDGGKQYDCEEFKQFKNMWKFEHRISSPHFARSNGLAERYVQEAKNLLKKCQEDNTDIYLALLHHRNTPRLDLGSPCQRLMNRRTKTLLPTNQKLFNSKVIKNINKQLRNIKNTEKKEADKGKKDNKQFTSGEQVWLRKDHQNWIPAKIVTPVSDGPRSYIVQTEDGGTYRRNAWHLKQAAISSSTEVEHNNNLLSTAETETSPTVEQPSSSVETSNQSRTNEEPQPALPPAAPASQPIQTRSGRLVVPPRRYR
ncbi:uncharacterized protein K02A2.6-like [Achroia grisella]|uniref:uncharacterized protein K02A2.6-like n=1 Tax=Achroia grisella TaxID=688607 RepID=UPI0027D2124B|nr:uncharacterized protein K02A2.6-like [Achroia grisella]